MPVPLCTRLSVPTISESTPEIVFVLAEFTFSVPAPTEVSITLFASVSPAMFTSTTVPPPVTVILPVPTEPAWVVVPICSVPAACATVTKFPPSPV